MNPDSPPDSGPDESTEALLRSLPFPALPDEWRHSVLAAAEGALRKPDRPWFRRRLPLGMAAAWACIAGLRLTTPSAPDFNPDEVIALQSDLPRPAGIGEFWIAASGYESPRPSPVDLP